MPAQSKAVLITGCSSGIGRATAELMVSGGHRVHATARKLEAIADLAEATAERIDCSSVTSSASVRQAGS